MTSTPEPQRAEGTAPGPPGAGRTALVLLALFFLLESITRTAYFHFGARATGSGRPFLDTLISETTGSAGLIAMFVVVIVPLTRRWPLRRDGWAAALPRYAAGFLVYTVGKTCTMWALRALLFPLAGLGFYDYGALADRFVMEGANDVLGFALLVALVHAARAWEHERERRLHQARLEASLHAARLQALQGQLQPHFLFNTLNTISSVMYGDPARADRLLSRLSELLRFSLQAPEQSRITIEQELQVLERYLEIMRARFEDRLCVQVSLQPQARGAAIPPFLLQPLVENAIEHGGRDRPEGVRIDVRIDRVGSDLRIRVDDDGPGPEAGGGDAPGEGIGLHNTRERLRLLNGPEARLDLTVADGGGGRAEVRVPFVVEGQP
ncbi:MAG: histidine kinase [Gemmatimonadota bacterium]